MTYPTTPGVFAGRSGLVVGGPGAGKTSFLLTQILKLTDQKLSFIAVDINQELEKTLAETLQKKGYRVLRLNPSGAADCWNPIAEITDYDQVHDLCASLLPIPTDASALFVNLQRDWLKAALQHSRARPDGSLLDAYSTLSDGGGAESLLNFFSTSPSQFSRSAAARLKAESIGLEPESPAQKSLLEVLKRLNFLACPEVKNAIGQSSFLMREVGRGETPTAVFLQCDETSLEKLGPILSFLTTAAMQILINESFGRKQVCLFLDDIGKITPIPGLIRRMKNIGSTALTIWMYFDTFQQINKLYGDNADAAFLANTDLQMFFNLRDPDARLQVSTLFGTVAKKIYRSPKRGGLTWWGQDGLDDDEMINVVEVNSLAQLEANEVIVINKNLATKIVITPYFKEYPEFHRRLASC